MDKKFTKSFPARFTGKCRRCDSRINPGDPITGEPKAWVHVGCLTDEEFSVLAASLLDVDQLINELLG
jgi:hypothetical protein